MPKILSQIVNALFFLWEIPQDIAGILVYFVFRKRQKILGQSYEQYRFFVETKSTGVSLGWFVFWTKTGNRYSYLVNDCRLHEFGHSIQSRILGPLYLVVIGIPSVLRIWYSKWYAGKHYKDWPGYFNGFPENWADRLGGVKPWNS
jgi:hypothetical protein